MKMCKVNELLHRFLNLPILRSISQSAVHILPCPTLLVFFRILPQSLPGNPNHNTIQITFSFTNGIQVENVGIYLVLTLFNVTLSLNVMLCKKVYEHERALSFWFCFSDNLINNDLKLTTLSLFCVYYYISYLGP